MFAEFGDISKHAVPFFSVPKIIISSSTINYFRHVRSVFILRFNPRPDEPLDFPPPAGGFEHPVYLGFCAS